MGESIRGRGCGWYYLISLEQNGRQFPDDILKCSFMNEKGLYFDSLNFVPYGRIGSKSVLVS